MKKKYKTGLVLSGGGARGFAHLGVIKALNEAGIYPEVISGTSSGAIVGAFYADGHDPEEVLSFFIEKGLYKYVEFIIPDRGLLRITGLYRLIREHIKVSTFEELKIPFYAAATDLNNVKTVYFSSGNLLSAVIASASIPVIFQPYKMNGITYVDGGVTDNLPVEPVRDLCEQIIGVNVNPIGYKENFEKMMGIAERTFHIAFNAGLFEKRHLFDIFIEPPELSRFGIFDIAKSREIFNLGYKTARKMIKGLFD